MREIEASETRKLEKCLRALAEYHNGASVNFKGDYQSRPYELSHSAVEDNGSVVGFGKIDICGNVGKLDYLVVLKEYRGKGYGKALMDWAMSSFDRNGVHHIELKVVD